MAKRIASAALWFLAVGWGLNYMSAMTGMPSIFGLLVAAGVGSFVGIDPLQLFWPRVTERAAARQTVQVMASVQTQS